MLSLASTNGNTGYDPYKSIFFLLGKHYAISWLKILRGVSVMEITEAGIRWWSKKYVLPQAFNFVKKSLWHKSFPVNFAEYVRTAFYRIPPRLFLKV